MWSLSALKTEDCCGCVGVGGGGDGGQTIYWNDVFTFLKVTYLGKSMTLYFIYLLISWSHSNFHLFNQKFKEQHQRVAAEVNSEVFLYCSFHALCCIDLFIETSTCTCAKGQY